MYSSHHTDGSNIALLNASPPSKKPDHPVHQAHPPCRHVEFAETLVKQRASLRLRRNGVLVHEVVHDTGLGVPPRRSNEPPEPAGDARPILQAGRGLLHWRDTVVLPKRMTYRSQHESRNRIHTPSLTSSSTQGDIFEERHHSPVAFL